MAKNLVRIYKSFSDLPPGYDALFAHNAKKSFYLSRDWFELIIRVCNTPGEAPRIYGLEQDAGAKVPLAALVMYGNSIRNRWYLGRTLHSGSNWYSSIFAPLLSPDSGDPAATLHALFNGVVHDDLKWDRIDIAPLDPNDATYIVSALRASGFIPQQYNLAGAWLNSVRYANFDEYWRSLSSKKRNTLRRKQKSAQANGTIEFRIYTDEIDLNRAVTDYNLVYAESWKQEELFKDFIPELIRQAALHKMLRLGIIYVNGEAAAAELCIAYNGVALMIKTAYREKFSSLSVGSLAIWKVLQHVLDNDRIHEIDFGNGDDTYKREWVQSRRERWAVVGFNSRTMRGVLGACWNIGGHIAKAKFRKLIGGKDCRTSTFS